MSDDDLGSFFEEINQIVATVAEAPVEVCGPEVGPQMQRETVLVSKPQVISKAAEIGARSIVKDHHVAASSHPVYTYAAQAENSSIVGNSSNTSNYQYESLQQFNPAYRTNSATSNVISSSSSGGIGGGVQGGAQGGSGMMASYYAQQAQQAHSTTTYTQPAPPAAVAPPQVPRQDKIFVRKAADETWVDETLQEWPDNDYRIFVGDLAKEVTTEMLAKEFQKYPSYAKAKVSME